MALTIVRVSVWTGVVGAAVALLCAIVLRRAKTTWTWSIAGALAAGAMGAVPWWHQQQRPPGPGMHDITTDTENPRRMWASSLCARTRRFPPNTPPKKPSGKRQPIRRWRH